MANSDPAIISILLARLERINVDSRLAHRASGIRRGLLDIQQELEEGRRVDSARIERHIQASIDLLTRAGRERLRKSPPLK